MRLGATEQDIIAVVDQQNQPGEKARFCLILDSDGEKYVRAVQGHSAQMERYLDMDQVLDTVTPGMREWSDVGLHGTFAGSWESIAVQGLRSEFSSADRLHFHFVDRVHDHGKTQGVRSGTDTIVAVDLAGLHREGVVIHRAPDTGVFLTQGFQRNNRDWWIPPRYIQRIYDKRSGRNYFTNRHLVWDQSPRAAPARRVRARWRSR